MGEGYARARPPVHPYVVSRIRERLSNRVARALDVGCGAGLSTAPLTDLAEVCVGFDPFEPMVRQAKQTAPTASFVQAAAERLPYRDQSFDLITAAGSLNYADLDRFFPEAVRVLTERGSLVVYDFSQGRTFEDSPDLGTWFEEFISRYPRPHGGEVAISPESLPSQAKPFRVEGHERFALPVPMTLQAYLDYVMTETNVANAPVPATEVRDWCARTLEPVFGARARNVIFNGYIAWLRPR
jgi:ubiquinone/menaquinone biosynthesis C-methylase UbiE